MKNLLIAIRVAIIVLGLTAAHASWAGTLLPEPSATVVEYDYELFTPDELDDLLAPIALYPDPLIAQILPAATFIDQIDEAARYVRQYGNTARIDDQPWDISVKAVAHYPDVLYMMDQKYDWTVSLGQAFINQQQDLFDSIQRLRAAARQVGSLESTQQQQVIIEDDVIQIVPSSPNVIYVPEYDPMVVYVERPYPSYAFITFGIGLTIGAWLNRDCDWQRHRVYYHGWRGGGWISRARRHISVRNNVYINRNYTVINVNRRVVQHDTVRYRENIRRNMEYRRERLVRPLPQNRNVRQAPARVETRGGASRPVTTVGPPPKRPENKDLYRGREIRDKQTAPYSGYGGYGSSKDARTYRERGQASRDNSRQLNRPQQPAGQVQRPNPAQRPAVTGNRQSTPAQANRPAPRQPAPKASQRPAPANRKGGKEERQR